MPSFNRLSLLASSALLAAAAAACSMNPGPSQNQQPAPGPSAQAQAPSAQAQPPASAGRGPGGGPGAGNVEASVVRGVISPEVTADHRVTFRLLAPNAKQVQLQGDFTIHMSTVIDMTKDASGVWSFTTEPLKPSSYQYWFIMDGATLPDPVNTYVRPASGVYKSQVDVPGPEMDFMAFKDVPHGVLNEHLYINRDNGTERRVVVYVPPGYNASNKSYPVLYLLHGANDFERGWTQTGRANLIMDNLLAAGKATPAIIVMPFGHDMTGSTGRQTEIRYVQQSLGVTPSPMRTTAPNNAPPGSAQNPGAGRGAPGAGRGGAPGAGRGGAAGAGRGGAPGAGPGGAPGGRGGPGGGNAFMEKDLLTNVMPLIEKEYRTLNDPNHRAIIGYSMGAGQSSSIGLNHPELFHYVGIYSGGAQQNAIASALADPAKTNSTYKMIWLGCGDDDTTALNGTRALNTLLTTRGITHTYVETPGAHHDYQVWRVYLNTNLPMLFKD